MNMLHALHHATQNLRKSIGNSEAALLTWVPYVHLASKFSTLSNGIWCLVVVFLYSGVMYNLVEPFRKDDFLNKIVAMRYSDQ